MVFEPTDRSSIPLVFEPGETWVFLVTDFSEVAGPVLGSPGRFAGSSVSVPTGGDGSNASILARPIPEPAASTAFMVGLAVATFGLRARR